MTKERKSTITLSEGATLVDPIPWDEIDPEIKLLVGLLNKQPGVETLHSCAGHEDDYKINGQITGYVTMKIDSWDNLIRLVQKIGIYVLTTVAQGDCFVEAYIECRERYNDGKEIIFNLHIRGKPLRVQRWKLKQVGTALSGSSPSCVIIPSSFLD